MEKPSRKKQRGCCALGCLTPFVVLLVMVLLDIRPKVLSEASPDGRFTARATITKTFSQVLDMGDMQLDLVDNLSGETTVVAKTNMGGMFEGQEALAVQWHPDGSRFACIIATNYEVLGQLVSHDTYLFQQKPLRARKTAKGKWVIDELSRRAKNGNSDQKTLAKKILQMKWSDW